MSDFLSRIRKASDPIRVKNIIVLLYGDPSMGKTSLSFTAENPFLLDFDRGIQRAVGRGDSMEMVEWADAISFLSAKENYIEENDIKTVIVDTAGAALDDFAALACIKEDSKNGKRDGGLTIGGYGALKSKFKILKTLAVAKGVDLILICHVKDEKEGDVIKKVPLITGGSYDILKQSSDLIGFMESVNGKRTLDFNPTDRHTGKNSPEFPKFELPHYTAPEWKGFLANIISQTKNKMNEMSESQKVALDALEKSREEFEDCDSIELLTELLMKYKAVLPTGHYLQLQESAFKKSSDMILEQVKISDKIEELDMLFESVKDDYKIFPDIKIKALEAIIATKYVEVFRINSISTITDLEGIRSVSQLISGLHPAAIENVKALVKAKAESLGFIIGKVDGKPSWVEKPKQTNTTTTKEPVKQ